MSEQFASDQRKASTLYRREPRSVSLGGICVQKSRRTGLPHMEAAGGERQRAVERFVALSLQAGVPEDFCPRAGAVGRDTVLTLLNWRNGALNTPAPSAEDVGHLLVELQYEAPFDDAQLVTPVRVLLALCARASTSELDFMTSASNPAASGDEALSYPAHLSGEDQRLTHSAKVCWRRYEAMHGGITYPPERRLHPSVIGAWVRAFYNGDTASFICDPLKLKYQMNMRSESAGVSIGSDMKLVIKTEDGESSIKAEFGKLSSAFEDIMAALEAAVSFDDDRRDGMYGMHTGVRKYGTEAGTKRLQRRYFRAMGDAKEVTMLAECVKRMQIRLFAELASTNVRLILNMLNMLHIVRRACINFRRVCQTHFDKLCAEIADNPEVWAMHAVSKKEKKEKGGGGGGGSGGGGGGGGSAHSQPCLNFYRHGSCSYGSDCRFRHTGKAPKSMRGGGRGGGNQAYGYPAQPMLAGGMPYPPLVPPPMPPPYPPPAGRGRGKG